MSDLMLKKQDIPADVTAPATKIKAAQNPEIEMMTGWLGSWNEPPQMPSGHGMSGMLSDDDMKKLGAAQGTEAARLFLKQMIAHCWQPSSPHAVRHLVPAARCGRGPCRSLLPFLTAP